MDDDALQLAAWRAGDADAGRRLVKTYYRLIFRFFYGKTADSACEDLTQEPFEILVRRRDAYRGDSPFRAYLYGIARNVLVGHIRRKLRHGDRFEPAEQSAVDPASEGSFSSCSPPGSSSTWSPRRCARCPSTTRSPSSSRTGRA